MNKKNKNNIETKSLVEGSIFVVLIVLTIIANLYVPFFEIFGAIIIPLIIGILYMRNDLKVSILTIVVSFILIIFIGDIGSAFVFILMNALPGIVFGYCIKNNKNAFYTIFFMAIAYAVGISLAFCLAYFLISGVNISDMINQLIASYNNQVNTIISSYKSAGINAQKIQEIKQSIPKLNKQFIYHTLPGYIIVTSILFSYINYLVSFKILKKIDININEIDKFSNWHLNSTLAGIIIGLSAVGIIMKYKNIFSWGYIYNTTMIVSKFIFIVFGLSFVMYLLNEKFAISKSTSIIILITLLIFGFYNVYFILGIADSIIDFRKFINKVSTNN